MNIERRQLPLDVELRQDHDKPKIVGHAAVFDKPADIWGFREVIRRGAFLDAIKKDDVRLLLNHDPNFVLGRNKSKTLTLGEDDVGLAIENDPPDTQWAKDLQISMSRGDISQMSFGFIVEEEKWTNGKDQEPDLREILKARLFDVSVVTYPAYEETDAQVRALRNAPQEIKDKVSNGGQGAPEEVDAELDQVRKLKHMKMKIL